MRRLILALAFAVIPAAAQAQQTPSLRDIIELSNAGVSDEILLALIEVHRPVYPVDADTLKGLKQAGVSPKVVVAMVRSGRQPEPANAVPPAPLPINEPAPAPQPQVVVIEHEHPAPQVREVVVPLAVPLQHRVYSRWVYPIRKDTPGVIPEKTRRAEPVYWGWGGKLRPDAWKPAEEPGRKR